MLKIAILDTIGLVYNGDTLKEKGLGGSESAIILNSKELSNIGFDVTVYCRCDKPGVYDGVKYNDLTNLNNINTEYDILVSSRNVLPFAPDIVRNDVIHKYGMDILVYKELVSKSKYKVLWMHDTFCSGDEYIQDFLADKYFNEIFTLSDWHTTYVATAFHNNVKRFPEFFKKHMFVTRNGIVNYGNDIDITKKDKDLFVFNASISKGMQPLILEVWKEVRRLIPTAKLKVIGGYYDFVDPNPNSFQNQFKALVNEFNGKDGIEFTGIIKQSEIADILKDASYFLYPNIYPETFGISVTEAINYNCLLVGFNFGALEEISPDSTSYNTEFHYGYRDISINLLVDNVLRAYHDDYLRQQKQYACNEFKPFLGWDVVALQWKHHFYKKLNMYLSIEEIRKHRYNIGNINRIYKKRLINNEEYFEDYSGDKKYNIIVVSALYNAEKYIKDHILSVASQNYDNYTHYILDDCSTDNTSKIASETIDSLSNNIKFKINFISNEEKFYAVGNQVETLNYIMADDFPSNLENSIVVLLDGDDTLVNDPDIFNYINRLYNQGIKFTYGSCHSIADNIDLIAQPYPKDVLENKTFRQYKFNWGMPYTHLRTFRLDLFNQVDQSVFKDENNEYWKSGGDNSTFYPLIEKCEPNEIKCVQRVLVNYNDLNPLNDYKVNGIEQNINANKITNNIPYEEILNNNTLHNDHILYLESIKDLNPKVIYDIGGNALLWYREANRIWKDSYIHLFEAIGEFEDLYKSKNVDYTISMLSDVDNKEIKFYQNLEYPAGSSYYRENPEVNERAAVLFNETNAVFKKSITLDTIVKNKNLPLPDLIKLDIQGAELDVLKGASNILEYVKDIILELPNVNYNINAPLANDVKEYLISKGFEEIACFSDNGYDADYHFKRRL